MERIPFDIIINNIIPYTYNIQPKLLLEDIKNYYTVKSKLMDDKYNIFSVKLEILVFFYHKPFIFNNILNRHYQINLKKYNFNNIKKYSLDKKFSILFGLFTKEERINASEYVLNVLNDFIIK
jgi:hypothetical protein